jgi:hypothetical protein
MPCYMRRRGWWISSRKDHGILVGCRWDESTRVTTQTGGGRPGHPQNIPYPSAGPYYAAPCWSQEIIVSVKENQFVFEVAEGYHCYSTLATEGAGDSKDWRPVHQAINGASANDQAGLGEGTDGNGIVPATSGDGKVVIVPSRFNDDFVKKAGHVRVFKEIDFGWQQLGQTLMGVHHGAEHFGFATAIKGTMMAALLLSVAFGTRDLPVSIYQGRMSVFQLVHEEDFIDGWELMGADLEGEGILLDYFGYSLSFCDTGTSLAVGAIQHGDAWQGYTRQAYTLGLMKITGGWSVPRSRERAMVIKMEMQWL